VKILLGVCGGIAVYKAAELTRELQRRGADVQVAMTASAEKFVTPLTFAALSGRQVLTSLWTPSKNDRAPEEPDAFDIEHIRVAQEIDAFVIAPATANMIAKLAHGVADDLLSTIYLATRAPVFIAPAMNVNMWHHPATQQNVETLVERGVKFVAPASGHLACGMVGDGRLADPQIIADTIYAAISNPADLVGETILITAGGTREPIDPVRYIGNRSSGKMGLALAEAAVARGAKVILITAAKELPSTSSFKQISVDTAGEMLAAVLTHLHSSTSVIMAAAVSDYRVLEPASQKLKKRDHLTLKLIRNEDILAHVISQRRPDTVVIGFAAETENVVEEGRRKLREKGADAIVANDVSQPDRGFEVSRNGGTLLTCEGEIDLPVSTKREMADRIFNHFDLVRASRNSRAETIEARSS
jgi:phosphopantothenoylcysteine decarboxylase/phosphopantothenate--cysteine ligase